MSYLWDYVGLTPLMQDYCQTYSDKKSSMFGLSFLIISVLLSGHEPPEHEPHAFGAKEGLRGQSSGERSPAAGQKHIPLPGRDPSGAGAVGHDR